MQNNEGTLYPPGIVVLITQECNYSIICKIALEGDCSVKAETLECFPQNGHDKKSNEAT